MMLRKLRSLLTTRLQPQVRQAAAATAPKVAPVNGDWLVQGVDEAAARRYLERFAPWRMLLQFDSGPRADEHETFQPFNRFPLLKLKTALREMDLPPTPAVLDVGFNCGYNALYMAQQYQSRVTGIDVFQRHKAAADELAELIEADAEFLLESAEEFERTEAFDAVLHFGTLYHLRNPIRSLECAARSLKPGGWLALETVKYAHDDPAICKWFWGFNGDRTNFWALGEQAIEESLQLAGLKDVRLYAEAALPAYGNEMTRAAWVARKP